MPLMFFFIPFSILRDFLNWPASVAVSSFIFSSNDCLPSASSLKSIYLPGVRIWLFFLISSIFADLEIRDVFVFLFPVFAFPVMVCVCYLLYIRIRKLFLLPAYHRTHISGVYEEHVV